MSLFLQHFGIIKMSKMWVDRYVILCYWLFTKKSIVSVITVMGWQNRLKFSGKTNRLKISLIFTILASFVCFFNFPDRNLIILYKITWKLPFRVR